MSWRLPADVETVIVSASFSDVDGGKIDGYVKFTSNCSWHHVASGAVIAKATYFAHISYITGGFAVTLPATDTATLVAIDGPSTYDVEIVLNRKVFKAFECSLPKATTPVNVMALVPIIPAEGGIVGGATAESLTIVLTAGAPFQWSFQKTNLAGLAENWTVAPHLVFGLFNGTETTWTSTFAGNLATFDIPAVAVDALIASNPISSRLYVGDVPWAVGGAPTVIQ